MKPVSSAIILSSLIVLAGHASANVIDIDTSLVSSELKKDMLVKLKNPVIKNFISNNADSFSSSIKVDGEVIDVDVFLAASKADSTQAGGQSVNCYTNCHNACHGSRSWR